MHRPQSLHWFYQLCLCKLSSAKKTLLKFITTCLAIGIWFTAGQIPTFAAEITPTETPTVAVRNLAQYEVPSDVPDGLPNHIVGDLGLAVYSSNMSIGATGTQTYALPYAFFDYERFFARIDTFGFKTFKMGYGYLEVAGQVNLDNYNRKSAITGATFSKLDPVPVGLGTFQETPIGGFFIYAFQDINRSQGQLYELSYFAEFETVAHVKLYPLLGAEYLTQPFANYYYGVTAKASQTLGYSQYTVPATTNYVAGLMIEVPIVDDWYFNVFGKRKFMGSGISNSPIMVNPYQDSLIASLVYRFK
jgi:MipA family protein